MSGVYAFKIQFQFIHITLTNDVEINSKWNFFFFRAVYLYVSIFITFIFWNVWVFFLQVFDMLNNRSPLKLQEKIFEKRDERFIKASITILKMAWSDEKICARWKSSIDDSLPEFRLASSFKRIRPDSIELMKGGGQWRAESLEETT